jgi:HPt (histidine-containing phosphotransfer) domain-containing protein
VSEFEARYQALRNRFLLRCAEDLAKLEAAAVDLTAAEPQALRLTVHRLAGASGTFGFPELGAIAGEADDALITGPAGAGPQIERLIGALRETLAVD